MNATPPGKVLRREMIVAMLRAALQCGEVRFARQASLSWLAAFPGDLEIALLQAQAIAAEGRPGQVIPALEWICRKDPFYPQAYRLLGQVCQNQYPIRYSAAMTSLFVLNGVVPDRVRLDAWGDPLRKAVLAQENRQYREADVLLQEVLRANPDLLMAACLHLLVTRATSAPVEVSHLAGIYHARWPDCLPVSLILAETTLELGNQPEAVRLLHFCAANDTLGQVACRLWGAEHPYRTLWPDDLVIQFDQAIPAAVAGQLGWNRLGPGVLTAPADSPVPSAACNRPAGDCANGQVGEHSDAGEISAAPEPANANDALCTAAETIASLTQEPAETPVPLASSGEPAGRVPCIGREAVSQPAERSQPQAGQPMPVTDAQAAAFKSRRQPAGESKKNETTQSVTNELERLAKKLRQPGPSRADSRCPVYVIFSSHEGLIGQYGPQSTAVLKEEMRKLAGLVRQRSGWSALVYYPDTVESTGQYGLTPVNSRDPWKLKNALADLDQALSKRGEMIGALLIVGGDPVVPFHRLPNPTDDEDGEVTSDSPYATLDANYFVPEWPVGRLPGEKGSDPGLLLDGLRQMQRYHTRQNRRQGSAGARLAGIVEGYL